MFGNGANAQDWELACQDDQVISSAPPQYGVENTGNHANYVTATGDAAQTQCGPNNIDVYEKTYVEVWCWDGVEPGIAWLIDAPNSTSTAGLEIVPYVSEDAEVEDPDIVITPGGLIVVVFIEVYQGNRLPAYATYEPVYDNQSPYDLEGFEYYASGWIHGHSNANSPNIDINDWGEIAVTWENSGSIYGKDISVSMVFGDLVTVQAAGALTIYRDPDICVYHDGDKGVTVTYVEEETQITTTQTLWVRQADLSSFHTGSMTIGPTQLGSTITYPDDYGAPRIATVNAANAVCTTQCEYDYVVVVRYYDDSNTEWKIQAYGDYQGSSNTPNLDVNNEQSGPSPSIKCKVNDRPVVAWPDGGVVVAWQLHDHTGCGDAVGGTQPGSPCAGSGNIESAADPSKHIIVEHLDDELAPISTGGFEDSYSVMNFDMDWSVTVAAISDGENYLVMDHTGCPCPPGTVEIISCAGPMDILYTGFYSGPTDHLIYKRDPWLTLNLKRNAEPADEIVESVYPNPFVDWLFIPARSVPGVLSTTIVRDAMGRIFPMDVTTMTDGSVVLKTVAGSPLTDGLYLIEMRGSGTTQTFKVLKAAEN